MGDEIQLDADHEFHYIDYDLRPEWPPEGMECDVAHCDSGMLTSIRNYRKHWARFHVPVLNVFKCSACPNVKKAERYKLGQHIRKTHQQGAATIIVSREANGVYIPPGDVLPRKVTKVVSEENVIAREAAAVQRRTEVTPAYLCDNQYQDDTSLSVRRDQYFDLDLENDEYEIKDKENWKFRF